MAPNMNNDHHHRRQNRTPLKEASQPGGGGERGGENNMTTTTTSSSSSSSSVGLLPLGGRQQRQPLSMEALLQRISKLEEENDDLRSRLREQQQQQSKQHTTNNNIQHRDSHYLLLKQAPVSKRFILDDEEQEGEDDKQDELIIEEAGGDDDEEEQLASFIDEKFGQKLNSDASTPRNSIVYFDGVRAKRRPSHAAVAPVSGIGASSQASRARRVSRVSFQHHSDSNNNNSNNNNNYTNASRKSLSGSIGSIREDDMGEDEEGGGAVEGRGRRTKEAENGVDKREITTLGDIPMDDSCDNNGEYYYYGDRLPRVSFSVGRKKSNRYSSINEDWMKRLTVHNNKDDSVDADNEGRGEGGGAGAGGKVEKMEKTVSFGEDHTIDGSVNPHYSRHSRKSEKSVSFSVNLEVGDLDLDASVDFDASMNIDESIGGRTTIVGDDAMIRNASLEKEKDFISPPSPSSSPASTATTTTTTALKKQNNASFNKKDSPTKTTTTTAATTQQNQMINRQENISFNDNQFRKRIVVPKKSRHTLFQQSLSSSSFKDISNNANIMTTKDILAARKNMNGGKMKGLVKLAESPMVKSELATTAEDSVEMGADFGSEEDEGKEWNGEDDVIIDNIMDSVKQEQKDEQDDDNEKEEDKDEEDEDEDEDEDGIVELPPPSRNSSTRESSTSSRHPMRNRQSAFHAALQGDLSNQIRKRKTLIVKAPARIIPEEENSDDNKDNVGGDAGGASGAGIEEETGGIDAKEAEEGVATGNETHNFDQFLLFSKDLEIPVDQIADQEMLQESRNRYLDSFTFMGIDCIDKYPPHCSGIHVLEAEEVQNFCVPDGIKVRVIPRAAMEGAKRLGWVGKGSHEYKFLVFTGGDGSITHGIVISTLEEVNIKSDKAKEVMNAICERRDRRNAARKIYKWLSKIKSKGQRQTQTIARVSESINRGMRRSSSFNGRTTVPLIHLNDDEESQPSVEVEEPKKATQKISFQSTKEPKLSQLWSNFIHPGRKTTRKSALRRNQSDPKINVMDDTTRSDDSLSFLSWDGKTHMVTPQKKVSEKAKKLGKESFDAMNSASAMGESLLLEKSFVVTGGAHSVQYMILRLLQKMVEMEGEENAMPAKKGFKANMMKLVGMNSEENTNDKLLRFRHEFLRVMREGVSVSSHKDSPVDVTLPTFTSATSNFTLPTHLPHIDGHWGVSALFTRLNAGDLLLILKTLIIERSILVIGDSPHLVTACTCAFRELLKPYQWASTFMPLLPSDMLDFVNSPCPFLIGMAVEDAERCWAIEDDERVAEAMEMGLTVVNLCTNSIKFTTEPDVLDILQGCPTPKKHLLQCQHHLHTLHSCSPPLQSFEEFVELGLSAEEISAINDIRRLVGGYLLGLSDSIGAKPDGWQHFGVKVEDGDDFDFYPSYFVDSLNQQLRLLECRVKFQEMMAYSQLFVEFVGMQRKVFLERNETENSTKGSE